MITSLIGGWPAILALLIGAAGVLFGMFKHQSAKVAIAQAATAKVEAQSAKDKLEAVSADQKAADAAVRVVVGAGASRTAIDAQVAAQPIGEAQKELLNEFGR